MARTLFHLPVPEAIFQSLCDQLVRNDAEITAIDRVGLTGYGARLGEALRRNTSVACLTLHVNALLPTDAITTEPLAPLLDYLRTSSTLLHVKLDRRFGSEHDLELPTADAIVNALAENRHVESFYLQAKVIVSSSVLSHLLQATTSLRQLTVHVADEEDLSIHDALGANTTLEHVVLKGASAVVEPLVSSLALHTTLRLLDVTNVEYPDEDEDDEIPVATPCASHVKLVQQTNTLRELRLKDYHFNTATIEPLLEALQRNSSVTGMAWGGSTLDEDATHRLVRFVQTECHRGVNQIRHIHLQPDFTHVSFDTRYYEVPRHRRTQPEPNYVAEMLVGSAIESLHIGTARGMVPDFNFRRFFSILAENAATVRLSKLQLFHLSAATACHRYLARTLSLRELRLERGNPHLNIRTLLRALKANGSLHSFVIEHDNDIRWNDVHRRLAEAYGQRNAELPRLLSLDRPHESCHDRLVPMLFDCAKPACRVAPNHLFVGLMACGDAAGGLAPIGDGA